MSGKRLGMKCYTCKYEGVFATLSVGSIDGGAFITGRIFGDHVGRVDLHACPHCGAIHSDFRGRIVFQDRGGRGEG